LQEADGLLVKGANQALALARQVAYELVVISQAAAEIAETGLNSLIAGIQLRVGFQLRCLEDSVAASGLGLGQLLL